MIYVNGMYRSGSTVIYNIVRHIINSGLIEQHIHKCHEDWNPLAVTAHDINIYSSRDVRTATASFIRKKEWTEYNFKHNAIKVKTAKEYMKFLVRTDYATKNAMRSTDVILKYEEDVLTLRLGVVKILNTLKVTATEVLIEQIYAAHNIKKVKEYVDTLTTRSDIRTKFHPNHISLEVTDWKQYLSKDSWDDIEILQWLEDNNYVL